MTWLKLSGQRNFPWLLMLLSKEVAMSAPKILVVFYSRSGATRRIAKALSTVLECSIEEIAESRPRNGFIGYCRSVIEARRKYTPDILPTRSDLSSFDLVVIGTPVWAWSVSSPVRAFLAANKDRLPDVAFFCTLGGNGSEPAFAQMQAIVGKAPRATCAIVAKDVGTNREGPQLMTFAAQLRQLVPFKALKSRQM
jgi:menaquinone-dependent protoporphyrinogen IX oxidase